MAPSVPDTTLSKPKNKKKICNEEVLGTKFSKLSSFNKIRAIYVPFYLASFPVINWRRFYVTNVIYTICVSAKNMPSFWKRLLCIPYCLNRKSDYVVDPGKSEKSSEEVLFIHVKENDFGYFNEYRPENSELTTSEFIHLYKYVVPDMTPKPDPAYCLGTFTYTCDSVTYVLEGWIPRQVFS